MPNIKKLKWLMSNINISKRPKSKFQFQCQNYKKSPMSISEFESQCQVSKLQKCQCKMSKYKKGQHQMLKEYLSNNTAV